ncbi:MAG: hypothetical protein PHC54_00640 [Candidatus Omnitrophica bacterium]|nr:hypothetical protein [Candidatus Omnitrophota bacterium]MDD5591915.1 hypothetical protein [Candidatus Omnitrophota bacterium]
MKKEILALIFILIASCVFFTNQKAVGRKLYEMAERQALQYRAGNEKSSRYQLYPHKVFKTFYFNFYNHLILPKDIYYTDIKKVGPYYVKNSIREIRWASFFISYCKGLIYVLFSPFFWSVNSVSQLMIYPQAVFWWGIMPCIIYGMIWSIKFKRKETVFIILFIGIFYSVLALTEGNVGALLRHKDWVTPFCLMFAAIGISKFIFGRCACRIIPE